MTDVDIVAYGREPVAIHRQRVRSPGAGSRYLRRAATLSQPAAERNVGLSVSPWARGKGIGSLLLERAGLVATARGIRTLFVRNLNFNAALRRLAQRTGMRVACASSARSPRNRPAGGGQWPRSARSLRVEHHAGRSRRCALSGAGRPRLIRGRRIAGADPDLTWRSPWSPSMKQARRPGVARL